MTKKEYAMRQTIERLSRSDSTLPENEKGNSRIMYIEDKQGGLTGYARIGRVTFSKTGKTLYYRGLRFQSLKGAGYKSNYFEIESGDEYWISGPKKNGQDTLYPDRVEIDEDVRLEYWRDIRGLEGQVDEGTFKSQGKHAGWRALQFTNKK